MNENEQKLSEKYKDLLEKSNTAYRAGVEPTSSDLALEKKQRAALRLERGEEASEFKKKWYDDDLNKTQHNYLHTLLQTLAAPAYAGVGLAESVLGEGSEPNVINNMISNIEEEGTYGDLLRAKGIPQGVAAPAGFLMDVTLDPLNWATLGGTSTVGKVARGFEAGGVKGALVGAKSGLLNYAEKAAGLMPGAKERAFGAGISNKYSDFLRNVASHAKSAKKELEEVTGKTIQDDIARISSRKTLGDTLREKISQTNIGGKLLKHGEYSPGKFFEQFKIDEATKLAEKRAGIGEIRDTLKKEAPYMRDNFSGKGIKVVTNLDKEIDESRKIATGESNFAGNLTDVLKEQNKQIEKEMRFKMQEIRKNFLLGKPEALEKFGKLTDEEVSEYYNMFKYYESGIKAWDKLIAKTLLGKTARKILKADAIFQGLFKTAKVPGNILTSGTNSIFGNTVMAGMMGLNVIDEGFRKGMKQALSITMGKTSKAIQTLFKSPGWKEVLKDNPALFEMVFGINPEVLNAGEDFVQRISQKMTKDGFTKFDGMEDTARIYDETVGKAIRKARNVANLKSVGIKDKKIIEEMTARDILSAENEAMRAARSARGAADRGVETSLLSGEILQGPYLDFLDKVKKRAQEGDAFAKAFHAYLVHPTELYNKFDQVFKLGSAIKMANHGVNEQELLRLAKRIDLSGVGDFVEDEARNLYRLSPIKAMEVANEAFMNYAAMPDFVKMMRKAPFIGNNFISFGYGMSSLAGKTLMNNPSYLNKVQFFMKEISGKKTPLEKKALQGRYYSWLNRPGMVKLPFFTKNPIYLNMENMIPYYTMNLLTPSERSYEDRFGNAATKIIDNVPFFKKPEGQLFLDYVFFPAILGEERAKGNFGQYMFPKDATIADKVAAFSKDAVSTVLPGSVGPVGFLFPEGAAKYSPLYNITKAINAKYGKTAAGMPSKEPASSRILSTLSGTFGFPAKQINLDFVKVNDDDKK